MAGKVGRLWRTRRGRVLIVGCAAIVVLLGATFAAAKATESNKFCGSDCHEMLPYNQTWEASAHADVNCVECHIPPGAWNFAKTKFFAMREVYVHVMGQVAAPIQVTRQIPNEVCVNCHKKQVSGQHIMSLPGKKIHPIKNVIDISTLKMIKAPDPTNPKHEIEIPDPNVPGKQLNCASCHNPHSSDYGKLFPVQRICNKCHKEY